MTWKELCKRYPSLVVDVDEGAPVGHVRTRLETRRSALDRRIRSEPTAELVRERAAVEAELDRDRVRLIAGRRGDLSGICVGAGETKADALRDAARRLGRA